MARGGHTIGMRIGGGNDNHIAVFEQKPNMESKPDELTMAYGDWAIPELVKKLADKNISFVLEAKVLKALAELCAQSERAGEAVKAGVVPVALSSDAIGKMPPSDAEREYLVLGLLGKLSLDTKGRKALLEGGALKQLYFLASQKRSLAAVALIVGQLCQLREGATQAFQDGYMEVLKDALLFGGEMSMKEATAWLQVLAKMLRESEMALKESTMVKGSQASVFLSKWRDAAGAKPSPEQQEWLCAALLVFHALTVEDKHKESFVAAGVVDEACKILVFSDTAKPNLSPCVGWEAKSHLLSLLAQLSVVVPGKVALADGTKYTWLPMLSNVLTDADSELLHTAALQALLHVVEHPKARKFLLECGIAGEVADLIAKTDSPFVQRIAKSFLDLLHWKP